MRRLILALPVLFLPAIPKAQAVVLSTMLEHDGYSATLKAGLDLRPQANLDLRNIVLTDLGFLPKR